jgi:2-succinyl-6-hydroxy-2,4-cyclohexadiene-1-carboxylate synthase
MDPRLRGGDWGKRGGDGGKFGDDGGNLEDDELEIPSFPRRRESIPLLLLHGFTGAASTWGELLPEFGTRRRVIALSLHGHGGSDAPDDAARYSAPRAAADVLEVLDMLGIARVALLGYSMGARVALHTVLAAPERVGALIVESGSLGIVDDAERAERRAADEALAEDIERHGVEAFVDRWERLPLWASQRQLSPAAREELRTQRLAGSARGLANSLRGLGAGGTAPLHERLGELARVPTLLICGALDEKYTRLAREMKELLPHAKVRVVERAGHTVHLERPHELSSAVREFLMEVEDTADGVRSLIVSRGGDCLHDGGLNTRPRRRGTPHPRETA